MRVEKNFNTTETELMVSDLKYWLKNGVTVLRPSNQPTKTYSKKKTDKLPPCSENEIYTYPSKFLPDTSNIMWRFSVKENHKRIGKKKIQISITPFTYTEKRYQLYQRDKKTTYDKN